MHRETTGLIGGRCKHSNVFSRAVLMHEGLIHAGREKSSRSGKVNNTFQSIQIGINSVGGLSEGGTPSPIPNLEVKPFSADGSSRVTVRKSRSLPTEFFISFATQESVATLSSFLRPHPPPCDGGHSIPQHTTPISRRFAQFAVPQQFADTPGPDCLIPALVLK